MISLETARRLKEAGLEWVPANGDQFVIPDRDMVVVHRVDTFVEGNNVTAGDFGRLLQMVLDAKL